MAALEIATNREVQYGAAFSLALSGDSFGAQTLANDLERNFPEDTSVRSNYVPSVRALLALNHGEPSRAIDVLQTAVPNELGQTRSAVNGFFGALYPVYVRGEAYMAARQGAEAVTEFQKILDHRGAVVGDPIGALAHLQLGRAYELSGDQTKAKIAYQDFLTLWKDADPDIPVRQQAKAAVMPGTSSALWPIISQRVYFQRCSGGSRHQKGSARAFSIRAGLIRRLARQVEGKGSLLFVTMAERVGFEPTVPCGTHAFQACALSHSAISPGP
jgi:hypothetical protein